MYVCVYIYIYIYIGISGQLHNRFLVVPIRTEISILREYLYSIVPVNVRILHLDSWTLPRLSYHSRVYTSSVSFIFTLIHPFSVNRRAFIYCCYCNHSLWFTLVHSVLGLMHSFWPYPYSVTLSRHLLGLLLSGDNQLYPWPVFNTFNICTLNPLEYRPAWERKR